MGLFFLVSYPSLSLAGACLFTEAATPSCSSPHVIPGTVGQHVVLMDVSTSTTKTKMSCSTTYEAGNIVYFTVTPDVTGWVTVSTCHPMTSYNTVLDVFAGTGCELFTVTVCNYNSYDAYCGNNCSAGGPSKVSFWGTAGYPYRIRVGSYRENYGN